jgi:signal peptidase II
MGKKEFHNLNSIIIAFSIIALDQISKYFFSWLLKAHEVMLFPFLYLNLVRNKGAGFGILQNQRVFFIIFSLIILGAIIYKWKKIPSEKNVSIPLGLITGGLIGNLIDRLFFGYVTDFIDFRIWPVFNFADSAISIGVIWLIIYIWIKK